MDLSQVKGLIAEDNLDEVFRKLRRINLKKSYEDDLIILQARFVSLQKKIRQYTTTEQDENIEKAKIRSALLEIINMIESDTASTYQVLSDEAKTILLSASLDTDGELRTAKTKDGWILQTNYKVLCQNETAKENIKWQNALDVLCDQKLIFEDGTRYKITSHGFDVAAIIEVSNTIDRFLNELGENLSGLPATLDGSPIPKKENTNLYKIAEGLLIELDLVLTMTRPETNATPGGWGVFRISPKGRLLLKSKKSSFSLLETQYQ